MEERFDVVVIGGGPAGIAAARAAADLGARTLLAERSDALGGNAANAFVHTICGLYRPTQEGDAEYAHPGFPRRFAEGLRRAGAAGNAERAGRVVVLATDPPGFAAYALRLCRGTRNLELAIGCPVTSLELAIDSRSCHRVGLGGSTPRWVLAPILLDTSGDAVTAALGGAESEMAGPEELQLPSYIFAMEGVDTSELRGFARLRLTHAVAGAVRTGDLPRGCEAVLVRSGVRPGEVYVTLNVPRPEDEPYAPLDSERRVALERTARDCAERVAAFLCGTRAAFAAARVLAWPRSIGIRETRRLRGAETVTREHVLEGRRHPDEVAVSTWPIELWQDHRKVRMEYPKAPCSVPLGALVSRSHPKLGMAGRCLSATHEALGALRVIGTALATGESLGVAAALAADGGVDLEAVAPRSVRERILELAAGEDFA